MQALVLALLTLGALLLVGKLGEEAFSRLNLIPFVGAIALGMALGPGVGGLLGPSPYVDEFVTIGIVFILFMAGAEELEGELHVGWKVLAAGSAAFLMAMLPMVAVLRAAGAAGGLQALLLSSVLAISSAGPLFRSVQETGISRIRSGRLMLLEVVVIEIAGVLAYGFLSDVAPSPRVGPTSLVYAAEVAAVILAAVLAGKYAIVRALRWVDRRFRSRESTSAILISIILVFGFLAQYVGFNAAIAAFLLGAFSSEYFADNPYMMEKMRGITYGLFEPMFFAGLGLYMTKISAGMLLASISIFAVLLALKFASGYLAGVGLGLDGVKNGFAVAHKGGVDAQMLLAALLAGAISPYLYSVSIIPVTLAALVAPIAFKGRLSLSAPRASPSIKFVRSELEGRTVYELSTTLGTVAIDADSSLRQAVEAFTSMNTRFLVVTDRRGRPLGYISIHDLWKVEPENLDRMKVGDLYLYELPIVHMGERASVALDIFEKGDYPVIAVVDDEGRLVGTVLEREVLRFLAGSSVPSSQARGSTVI